MMDRRGFLKGVGQAGLGMQLGGSLLGKERGLAQNLGSVTPMIPLDGQWLLATDAQNVGRAQKWYARILPEAQPTRVPGIIQETFPGYHGVAWYWHEFTPPQHPHPEGRYLLRFGVVDYMGIVWVNGVRTGEHEGGETLFTLDITGAVKPGVTNLLAVWVLNPTDKPIDGIVLKETPHRNKVVHYVPGNGYDYGGIEEPVELILSPAVRVEDTFVRPDWKTGNLRIQTTVRNATQRTTQGHLRFSVAPAAPGITGNTLEFTDLEHELPPGDTRIETRLQLKDYRLWDLDNPYLYRVTERVETKGGEGYDEVSTRCGFRDFRVVRGYFRLNGKRLFLRSTHTGNHCPITQTLSPHGVPDLLRLDMLYAKASGFNAVRFISGVAHPYQLDLCDELGLMVYEESLAAWLLADSPKMKERYEFSVRDMVMRDRNHPSIVMWGMLNETKDGPVFREAVSALSLVRSLDETRLVLLGSGRFDGQLSIGSVSNPGSSEWEYEWGKEGPHAPSVAMKYPSGIGVGDFHFYPQVPQTPEIDHLMRTLGHDSKPVFLSEYGIGSMMDVTHEARGYEQARAHPDTEDYLLLKSEAKELAADWKRFGMEGVYPYSEGLLRDSQRRMARHRLLGFNLIRSNPKLCGYNLTGMLDHGMTGEGVWRFWRDRKPGAMDAMQDGWAPVRWCLFAEPTHTYVGRPVQLEAVLANEDILRPGDYPVQFRVWGSTGIVWERESIAHIPKPAAGEDGPLALPVMKESVALQVPGGSYELVPYIEKGAAPPEASWQFYLTDPASLPQLDQKVTFWGIPEKVKSWLRDHGVKGEEFSREAPNRREIIVAGDLSKAGASGEEWRELARRMARGSVGVFLSPAAFKRGKESTGWLPLAKKGRAYRFNDWLYHKECVAKAHPIFEGLQGKGILDWHYYGPVWPHFLFDGQETPDEVVAAAFAAGYSTPGGYASGILLGGYRLGEGRFTLNTFPLLEHVGEHPAADRLLLNLVHYAAGFVAQSLAQVPAGFDNHLKAMGYYE